MLIRNYSTSPRFLAQFLPLFFRVFVRSIFATNFNAQRAMAWVALRRAFVWLPFKVRELLRGVKMPVTLQVVDDVACRAGCGNCVFTAFKAKGEKLSLAELERLFDQALGLNITNVYLMGADPFYRENAHEFLGVLAKKRHQIFFLFSEGKRFDDTHLAQIRAAGNIIPVLNIDGLMAASDRRKGEGTFARVEALLDKLQAAKMPYFVTTMVSRANYSEVTGPEFARWLDRHGAWVMAYVPYTPVDARAEQDLVMDAAMRDGLLDKSMELNREVKRLVILDLLGIEQQLTSCPAAVYTVTVYHDGTATPCPAIPFGRHDGNVKEQGLASIFFEGHLYRAIRNQHKNGKVHCMFYTDQRFLAGYIREHRPLLKVLNPGAVQMIEEQAAGLGGGDS